MITLYFSGTGNTKFLAEVFSRNMGAKCLSIEADADFVAEITAHDTIAVCYPIYHSRVPLVMRRFVHAYKAAFAGKKLAILVTQQALSGDGARVFTDLFAVGEVDVIYAEHFNMQQNMGNIPVWSALFAPTTRSRRKFTEKTETKVRRVCESIKNGVVKKRGFTQFSQYVGYIQGKPWQKDTASIMPVRLEKRLMQDVRIHPNCTSCGVCAKICPMKNLQHRGGQIRPQNNCTVCYRCVNRCPQKAITVYVHRKPKWQYHF